MGTSAVTNVLAAGMATLRALRPRAAKHLAIAVLSVAFAVAVIPSCGAQDVGIANKVVNDVYGNSVLTRMKNGEPLVFNQKIRTGVESAADLIFLDDSELVIGERAEVTIDEFIYDPDTNVAKGAVNVAKGVLRFASATAKLDVSLKTQTATIGIRGTVFDVLASFRSTEIAVLEGAVEVVSRFGTDIVRQGQVLSVSDTGGPSLSTRASDEMRAAVAQMFETLGPVDGAGRAVEWASQQGGEQSATTASATDGAVLTQIVSGKDLENLLFLDLVYGRVVIEMRPDLAPRHVARVKELTRNGFYDGLIFHNVVRGFVAETGDPTSTGTGGSGTTIAAELSEEPFLRGVIGMKHKLNEPDTADSQFFVLFGPAPHLDGEYTVWGQVIFGMQYVDLLNTGQPPRNPDRIIKLQVAADAAS